MHIEFYLQSDPGNKLLTAEASFVGELFLPWKHCTEPDNIDKWSPEEGANLFFRDEDERVKDLDGLVQGSSTFIKVKWVPLSSPLSAFEEDGITRKKKKK